MKNIAIVRGFGKDELGNIQKDISWIIKGLGFNPIVSEKIEDIVRSDFIISLGGDGSILSLARRIANTNIPVLGINLGQTGFLTELEMTHIEELGSILKGDYYIDERMLLQADISNGTSVVALNDIAIKSARMVVTNVFIDAVFSYKYNGDGIVISTPTGSTAYSRNLGGSVVQPNMDLFIVNPVSPTKRYSDSLIIPATSDILLNTLGTKGDEQVTFIVDGQDTYNITTSDNIYIRAFPNKFSLVRRKSTNLYHRLVEKL